jgi:hypothetical protein
MKSNEFYHFPGFAVGEFRRPTVTFPATVSQTALDLARQEGHADVVEYLQSKMKP